MRIDRRSALIGTASLIGLGGSQAFAQSQGVPQAAANAVAASRAEHTKLLPSATRNSWGCRRRPDRALKSAAIPARASIGPRRLNARASR